MNGQRPGGAVLPRTIAWAWGASATAVSVAPRSERVLKRVILIRARSRNRGRMSSVAAHRCASKRTAATRLGFPPRTATEQVAATSGELAGHAAELDRLIEAFSA